MNRLTRRLHRWGALVTFLPMLVVILSGLLLQVKKEVSWVQPPTLKGQAYSMHVDWEKILQLARSIKEAQVEDWSDISRLDVRPDRGLIKVFCNNHWEIQLDSATGDLLSSTYRRSDWIEQLHDGSFFSDAIKRYVFLPNGLILLGLWMTGVYLWWLPVRSRQRKRARHAANESAMT